MGMNMNVNRFKRGARCLAERAPGNQSKLLSWLALILIATPLSVRAVTPGQIDDFQDGTAQNWRIGVGPVGNVATGGPTGAGDRYIQYTSLGGFGAQSRMIVFNDSQWTGNYIGSGTTSIALDLANFGAQPLSIRIAFRDTDGSGYSATTAFSLAADSQWHHTAFTLTAGNFTAIGSPSVSFNDLLTNFTGQLRILDSASPSLLGDPIAATLGIDNVQAIPEPSSFMMVGVAFLMLLLCFAPARNLSNA